jgi:hypothetical protein
VHRRSGLVLKTPGPGGRANKAIKVASEVLSEDVNAELSVLQRETIRLKARRFKIASESPSEDVNAELTFLGRKIIRLESVWNLAGSKLRRRDSERRRGPKLSFLKREIIRLEACAFEVASERPRAKT